MLQVPFFRNTDFSDIRVRIICFEASIGNANIVLLIFLIGRLLFKSWYWSDRLNAFKSIYLCSIGGFIAIHIEMTALDANRWSYSEIMPTIPLLGVGIIPVMQLLILPYVSYKIADKIHSLTERRMDR